MSRVYKPATVPVFEWPPAANVMQFPADSDDEQASLPFPVDALPPPASRMANAIAEAERVPTALSGCCVMGVLSASIGAGLLVQSGKERVTRGNLYILASADSGTGKSASFRCAVLPLHEYERDILDDWRKNTLPRLQAERDLLENEVNALKKTVGKKDSGIERDAIRRELEAKKARLLELDSAMQPPVLTVEDVTSEKLAYLLAKRGEVLASLSPDAGNIVNNLLGRYNKLDRTDESIYLKAYSGDYTRVDRIGRDPVVLHHPCLAVLWLTQPDKLDALLQERSLTDGGLIPRLLICHTHAQPTHITGNESDIPEEVRKAYRQLVRDLLATYRHAADPFIIQPTEEASRLFTEYHNKIVDKRLSDLRDIPSFAARWAEQAWRISVVLHAARYGAHAHKHDLSQVTAQNAIKLAEWFAAQQLDILSGGRWQAQRDRQRKVLLLLAENPEGITARDIQRARIVKSADEAQSLLAAMEQEGKLVSKDIIPAHGGKISRRYMLKVRA